MLKRPSREPSGTGRLAAQLASVSLLLAAASSMGCASKPTVRPAEPIITGDPSWPDDVMKQAERIDRLCNRREGQLANDYKEGKEEEQKFKTLLGSITGGVGTVGGVVGGVGAFAINSPDDVKTITGVTGFISAGLGAAGSVVTAVVSPGTDKMKSSSESLAAIEEKKSAARTALEKDPASWSDTDREAWSKASKDVEAACKP